MAIKKTYPELERLRAVRSRQAATLARRQGSVLGKEARERLRPLIESASKHDHPIQTLAPKAERTLDYSSLTKFVEESFRKAIMPPFSTGMWASSVFLVGPPAPSINAGKLEALKSAAPFKVQPQMPDMVQVITAWRGWALTGGLRLKALGGNHEWPCREIMQATCSSGGAHVAPDWNCNCGVWAFKDVDSLVAAIGGKYRAVKVIGSVSLWGKVIETENGYRAQYAYPSELWLLDDGLEQLSVLYDVPIRKAQSPPL